MRKLPRAIVALILKWEAKFYITLNKPSIVAIAGITGKNALKRMIAQELSDHDIGVRAHPRGYNTDIGLPLAILFIEPESFTAFNWLKTITKGFFKCLRKDREKTCLVVELGVSQAGDMKTLLDIITPEMLLILDIIEHPQSRVSAAVLLEEVKLAISRLSADGALIVNIDSSYLADIRQKFPLLDIVTYGFSDRADYKLASFDENNIGVSFLLDGQMVKLAQHGKNYALFYAAARAVRARLK